MVQPYTTLSSTEGYSEGTKVLSTGNLVNVDMKITTEGAIYKVRQQPGNLGNVGSPNTRSRCKGATTKATKG